MYYSLLLLLAFNDLVKFICAPTTGLFDFFASPFPSIRLYHAKRSSLNNPLTQIIRSKNCYEDFALYLEMKMLSNRNDFVFFAIMFSAELEWSTYPQPCFIKLICDKVVESLEPTSKGCVIRDNPTAAQHMYRSASPHSTTSRFIWLRNAYKRLARL